VPKEPNDRKPSENEQGTNGSSSAGSGARGHDEQTEPKGLWFGAKAESRPSRRPTPVAPAPDSLPETEPDSGADDGERSSATQRMSVWGDGEGRNSLMFDEEDSHDAWTADRISRRSTRPPSMIESYDQLLEEEFTRPSEVSSGYIPTPIPMAPVPDAGGALDLADRSDASQMTSDLLEEMEELYSIDECTGALRIAELILGSDPDNEQALSCAASCRERLEQVYASKVGPLNGIPTVAMSETDIRWLGLDHRAGFVLSRIDGKASVEELLDICGMPRLEVLKTMIELLNQGAIAVEAG
jgi:hypothetical protein